MKAKRANSPKNSPITLSLDHPSKGPITKNTKLHARKFPEKKSHFEVDSGPSFSAISGALCVRCRL
jgi:hypothetical protein